MTVTFAGYGSVTSVSYNGVDLYGTDGAATTISISEEPSESDDRASRIGNVLSINVEGILRTDGNVGDQIALDVLRDRLNAIAKPLVLNVGYGRQKILYGADFTPKPRIMYWKPLVAGGRAAAFAWQCQVMDTTGMSSSYNSVVALRKQFTISNSYNESGSEVRNVSGYVELVAPGRSIVDVNRIRRDLLQIGFRTGFNRTSSFVTSSNRRRVDFTIVDTQIESPNAYPAGIEKIEGEQGMEWSRGSPNQPSAAQLTSSMDLSMKRFPGTSAAVFYQTFKKICESRYNRKVSQSQKQPVWLLLNLSASESLFGYTARFSATFKCFLPISEFLVAGNLWQPLDFLKWNDWAAARNMTADFWRAGVSNHYWNPIEDIVLDTDSRIADARSSYVTISGDQVAGPGDSGSKNKTKYSPPKGPETKPYSRAGGNTSESAVPAAASYSKYEIKTYVLEEAPVSALALLAPHSNQVNADVDPFGSVTMATGSRTNAQGVADPLRLVHSGGPPTFYVGLAGKIERVDHPIAMPELKLFGGQQCVRVKKYVARSTIGNAGGHPISRLEFFALYAVAGVPNYEQLFNPAGALQTKLRGSLDGAHIKV